MSLEDGFDFDPLMWPPKDPWADPEEDPAEFLHWPRWWWDPDWPPRPPPSPSAGDVLKEVIVEAGFSWILKSFAQATAGEIGVAAGAGVLIGGTIGSAVPVFAGDDPNPSHHGLFGGASWWYDELTGKGPSGLAKDLWHAIGGD